MLDSLYPGTFPFKRVKWNAKTEYEYVENYKVLQLAFDKNGIKRHIDTAKLVKARPLDNLEFCQWLYAYFQKNYSGDEYDALGRRNNQDLFYILGGNKVGPPPAQQPRSSGTGAAARSGAAAASSNTGPRQAATGGAARAGGAAAAGGGVPRAGAAAAGNAAANNAKVKELETTVQELRLQNDTLDKERDFYFTKLRDIEMLLQGRPMEPGPGNDLG